MLVLICLSTIVLHSQLKLVPSYKPAVLVRVYLFAAKFEPSLVPLTAEVVLESALTRSQILDGIAGDEGRGATDEGKLVSLASK